MVCLLGFWVLCLVKALARPDVAITTSSWSFYRWQSEVNNIKLKIETVTLPNLMELKIWAAGWTKRRWLRTPLPILGGRKWPPFFWLLFQFQTFPTVSTVCEHQFRTIVQRERPQRQDTWEPGDTSASWVNSFKSSFFIPKAHFPRVLWLSVWSVS